MVIRRNDTRRRRVVVEPALHSTEPCKSADLKTEQDSETNGRPYSFGADRRNQLKTTDLLPKRLLSCALVILTLLVTIGGLNLLAAYASEWRPSIGESSAALALVGRGTLASWFTSFLLIISGLASLQIYALRLHRRDDYRGTYRLWLWIAALLMLGSLNCVVDLSLLASSLLHAFTSISFEQRPWLPVAIKVMILSTLVARGLYEVRASSGTFVLVLFVWLAYSIAAVLQLPTARPEIVNLSQETLLGNSLLFGTAVLLLAELTYARFIYLQAHGLMKQRTAEPNRQRRSTPAAKKQTKSSTKAASTEKSESNRRVKTAPGKQRKAAADSGESTATTAQTRSTKRATKNSPSKSAVSSSQTESAKRTRAKTSRSASGEDLELESVIKLSKAERRRKRKEERRRRAA
jgi:hypothetical protein